MTSVLIHLSITFHLFEKQQEGGEHAKSSLVIWIFVEELYANRVSRNAFGIMVSYSENRVYVSETDLSSSVNHCRVAMMASYFLSKRAHRVMYSRRIELVGFYNECVVNTAPSIKMHRDLLFRVVYKAKSFKTQRYYATRNS